MRYAPIVVFAYRRPEHLRSTLASLMRCEGFDSSPVIVYCDGPRNSSEREYTEATRAVAQSMLGDKAAYRFSDTNRGLACSVISGVSEVLDHYDRVIVVEDDLQLESGFLSFLNTALMCYASAENVFQVSGHMFDVPDFRENKAAVFQHFTTSWGWATWKRAWRHFDSNATGWEKLKIDRQMRHRFNFDGVCDYTTMLIRQMNGKGDSWAIRWYWSVFKAGGVVLFPPVTLVHNTGFDGSGTHGRGLLRDFSAAARIPFSGPIAMPESVCVDEVGYDAIKRALAKNGGSLLARMADYIRRCVSP